MGLSQINSITDATTRTLSCTDASNTGMPSSSSSKSSTNGSASSRVLTLFEQQRKWIFSSFIFSSYWSLLWVLLEDVALDWSLLGVQMLEDVACAITFVMCVSMQYCVLLVPVGGAGVGGCGTGFVQ